MKSFKYFLYKIASLKYGKIKFIENAKNIKDINIKQINLGNKCLKKIYEIRNYRLYTDRIHNLALIHKNYLIEGPSYQIINNNLAKINKNIVLKIGTPRALKKIKGTVISLLSGGAANSNYFHWLYDVLPRINIISKIIKLKKIDYLLLPSNKKKFQVETLKVLGFKSNQFLPSEVYRHITSDKILISEHPWIKSGNSSKDELNIPFWIYKWLKKTFLYKNINKNKKKYPKKIFIVRRNKPIFNKNYVQRILSKEKQIIKLLKDREFAFVDLENFSFLEQVKIFNNAKIIVGVHGAGFANIVFCKKNTKIIEFKTKYAGNIIKNIAIKNNLNYYGLISKKNNISNVQNGIIEININRLKKII